MKKILSILVLALFLFTPLAFASSHFTDHNAHAYISTATTTTIKSGVGTLAYITVDGGTAGTIIVYDNTAASGTIIASFDSTNALETYHFDTTFTTGLTIITGAATKISVSYR